MEQKGYDRAQREANQTIAAKDAEIRKQKLALAKAIARETTLQLKAANLDLRLIEEQTRHYHATLEVARLRKEIIDLHQKERASHDAVSCPGGS